MADDLTDEELLALPNGDPLLGKLTSEEARRRTVLQTGKPLGSAQNRQDSTIVGVDHAKLQQGISNWASKLPLQWQRPAATIAAFPADVLASLAEVMTAPEVVGTSGLGMAATEAATAGAQSAAGAVKDAAGAIPRPTGAQVLKAVKVARHPLREGAKALADEFIARMEPKLAQQTAKTAEAAPAVVEAAPMATQVTTAAKPLAFNPSQALATARETFAKLGETPRPAEVSNAMELIRRGKAPEEAVQLVIQNRSGVTPPAPSAFAGLPTDEAMRAQVAARNKTGRWSR